MKFQAFAFRVLAVFPLVVAATAGCSSSEAVGPVDVPGYTKSEPMALEDYCAARVAREGAWCEYFDRCCDDGAVYAKSYCDKDYANVDTCVSTFQSFMADSGTVYAGAYAQASLDEVFNRVPEVPSACNGSHLGEALRNSSARAGKRQDAFRALFQGHRGKDSACEYSASCEFGLACQGTSGSFTCQPRGLSCSLDDNCAEGYVCEDNFCRLPPASGSSCSFTSDCPFGLVCSASKICSDSVGNAGEACSATQGCKPENVCAVSGTSTRCAALKTAGSSCTADGECSGSCKAGRCVGFCGGTGIY
jgi:hypothetical protein